MRKKFTYVLRWFIDCMYEHVCGEIFKFNGHSLSFYLLVFAQLFFALIFSPIKQQKKTIKIHHIFMVHHKPKRKKFKQK